MRIAYSFILLLLSQFVLANSIFPVGEIFEETFPIPGEAQAIHSNLRGLAPYVSEESGNNHKVCKNSHVTHISCAGRFCDNMHFSCGDNWPGPTTGLLGTFGAFDVVDGDFASDVITTEYSTRGDAFCPVGYAAVGFRCKEGGRFCSHIALSCRYEGNISQSCKWSKPISEESQYDPIKLNRGGLITGIRCAGSYCDNKQFYGCAEQ